MSEATNREQTAAESGEGTSASMRWACRALCFVVFSVALAAFWPTLNNQFVNWDDSVMYFFNRDFRGLSWDSIKWMCTTFHMGHYQPITWLTLGLDYELSKAFFERDAVHGPGLNPRPYHLTSSLIHALNTALVFAVSLRLLGWGLARDGRHRTWPICLGAAAAAILWGVHPLRVENVAWATERRDVVNAMFMLLATLAYLEAHRAPGQGSAKWLVGSVLLFILSLLSKVSSAPLAVVLLAVDWFPLRRFGKGSGLSPDQSRQARTAALLEKLPFLVPAIFFGYIASSGQAAGGWIGMYPYSLHPLTARIAQAFYGLTFYAWKTVLPLDLLPVYELRLPLDPFEPRFVISLLIVLCAAATVVATHRRWPGLAVATLAYAAFLGPVLGFFQNGPQLVADRYAYLSTIGLMVATGGGLAAWLGGRPPRAFRAAVLGAVAILSGALIWLTWSQCEVWRDTRSLWLHVIANDPQCAIAHNSYGVLLSRDERRPGDAIAYFRRASELDPGSKVFRDNLAKAMYDAQRFDDLIAMWIEGGRSGGVGAREHFETGLAVMREGMAQWAFIHLSVASGIDPEWPEPRFALAVLLARQNRTEQAMKTLERLLEVRPDHAEARRMLEQLRSSTPSP